MSRQFYLYPTLNDNHIVESEISYSNIRFYYHDNRLLELTGKSNKKEILYEGENQSSIELNDKSGVWDVSIDDLNLEQSITISNPSALFGDNGIVVNDCTIGVALNWFSKQSLQRGSIKIGSITQDCKSFNENMILNFNAGDLTGILEYSVVLFVEEPNYKAEQHVFANESGLNLGTIFTSTIVLEGEESSFPIVSIESPEKPLWSLYYSWGSLDDEFKDTVILRLNKSHTDYKLLNMEENKSYNEPLFKQILIQVVTMILEKAKSNNEIDVAIDNDEFANGTVGSLIKYYVQTYDVNYESYETILESVMKGVWSNG